MGASGEAIMVCVDNIKGMSMLVDFCKRALLIGSLMAASMTATAADSSATTTSRSNYYPIVLVHGLMGWKTGEVVFPDGTPYLYWGYTAEGSDWDILKILNDSGHAAYESEPSPVLNDHERAVQIYAQLTGTQADFGAASAAKLGRAQFGKTYAPLFEGFCQDGHANQKINLLGHSQGGTTARMLAELLANGDPAEIEYANSHDIDLNDVSPLFKGGQGQCVHSVTTLSSPHDGTSLAKAAGHIDHLLDFFVTLMAVVEGVDKANYNFDVEHWGIVREPGESFSDYLAKVKASTLWDSISATSFYSLSTDGAHEQNQTNRALPNVYYISQSTERTSPKPGSARGCYVADEEMFEFMKPTAAIMGCYTYADPEAFNVTKEWFANDGLVNTNSEDGPTISNSGLDGDEIQTEGPKKGSWYHLGIRNAWDHGNIVGLEAQSDDIRTYYLNLAYLIDSLPE